MALFSRVLVCVFQGKTWETSKQGLSGCLEPQFCVPKPATAPLTQHLFFPQGTGINLGVQNSVSGSCQTEDIVASIKALLASDEVNNSAPNPQRWV